MSESRSSRRPARECPSCGRFTGPYEACPYCGARLRGRTSLRVLKIAAVVLALVGLAGLWFAATRVEVPRVQIDQVGGMMNMAYVRIEGRVCEGPDYDPEGEVLAFWVDDDTGKLRVSAYRNETRELIGQGKIPAVGDQVSIAGTLRIRDDFLALYLNAPEQLEITRPEPEEVEIAAITALDLGRRVRVRGQVLQVRQPYTGLTLIKLRDASKEIDVAVTEALERLTGPLPEFTPGQALEVVAAVSFYGESPQLIPASTADLALVSALEVSVPQRAIGSLISSDVEQWVQVEGAILETDPFAKGVRFILDDESGQILLVLWQDLYEQLPYAEALDVGARVQVQGRVKEYEGALEIVPDVVQDVVILVAAPSPEEVPVAALGLEDVGRMVWVRGVLGEADPFSKGVRYPLDDGSGEIVLLLWSNVAEQAPAGLGPGTEVRVVGEIDEYKEELEIVPRRGSDIEVLGQRPLPTPTPVTITPIEEITEADEGRILTVEGVLGEGRTLSAGVSFPLSDESGEIVLWLWQDVYDAFPENERLVAGVRLRVTGEITIYDGTLEIVPAVEGMAILD